MKSISEWLKNHKDSKVKIKFVFLEETREGPSSVFISMAFPAICDYDRDDVYLGVSEQPNVTKLKALKQLTDEDLYDILENMYNKGMAHIAKLEVNTSYGIRSRNKE